MPDDAKRSYSKLWRRLLQALVAWRRPRTPPSPDRLVIYTGGCHCRRVRFEVRAPARLTLLECNCSICRMAGYLHLVVPAGDFTLVSGEDKLTSYRFETKTAEHTFCSVCGIKSFYVPRADPWSRSINARCLDDDPGANAVTMPFDGKNWGGRQRHI